MNKGNAEKKKQLVIYKGGLCQGPDCHYRGPLLDCCYDFHHRDPIAKSFMISRKMTLPLDELKSEVDKCDMLCAVCHRIITSNDPIIADKIREGIRGIKRSDGTRELIRRRHIGMKYSPEAREHMRLSHLGKKDSPETVSNKKAASLRMWQRRKAANIKLPTSAKEKVDD